jgi:hypothetical protein
MKITKETRNHFNPTGLSLLKSTEERTRLSFSNIKKVALILREFQRVKNLNRDYSCGIVNVVITQRPCGSYAAIFSNIFTDTLQEFCEVFAKRDSEPVSVKYEIERKEFFKSLTDMIQFFFDSFTDFVLKIDQLKPKEIMVEVIIDKDYCYIINKCE